LAAKVPESNEKSSFGGRNCRRLGSETVSTKIGLSSGAVTVFSSLRDELPEFRAHRCWK
jgi:hypothetical protein